MIIEHLKKIFGEINASDSELNKFIYSTDASKIEGNTLAVVFPTNIEQIRKLVRLAKRLDVGLVPRGSGTNIVGACVPDKSIVVDMCKMDRVLDNKNEFLYVEAGKLIEDLNYPFEGSHTIGGMIALNPFNCIKEFVTELEVIDGTAKFRIIKEKELDNFIGKEGSTGIILSAKLKKYKEKKVKSVDVLGFNTITGLMKKVKEKIEDLNVLNIKYLDDSVSDLIGLNCQYHLIIEYLDDSGEEEFNENLFVEVDSTLKTLGFILDECPLMPDKDLDKYLYWLNKNEVPTIAEFNKIKSYFKKKELRHKEVLKIIKKFDGKINTRGMGLRYKQSKEYLFKLKEKYDPKDIMNRGKWK